MAGLQDIGPTTSVLRSGAIFLHRKSIDCILPENEPDMFNSFFSLLSGLTKASTNLDANHQTPVTSITKPDVSRSFITVFTSTYHYKGTNKPTDNKTVMTPETTTETVITDTDILLAGADDESDPDPLRHLFPLLNTSPTPLSPSAVLLGSPLTSPLDENHLHSSSPHTRVSNLTSSPSVSVHSPFQPIGRGSPFQPVAAASPSKSVTSQAGQSKVDDDCPILQPLAQGYVISTVHTGKLPSFFWANYPQAEKLYPVILRVSILIVNKTLKQPADPRQANSQIEP